MKYTVQQICDVLKNNAVSPEDLIPLLEISIEDILDRFPDFVKMHGESIINHYGEEVDDEYEGEEF